MANMKTEAMVAEASRKLEDGIRADLKAYVAMLEQKIVSLQQRVTDLEGLVWVDAEEEGSTSPEASA
jgi:uncharacterized protein YceH (UPF0502 family)